MTTFLQDIRYAVRMLAKNPGVTCVMVFSLALAIGANTAIFSVVYGVLLRPLPYPKSEQIVKLNEVNAKGGVMNFADPNFDDARSLNHTLQGLAAYTGDMVESVSGGAEPTRTVVVAVSRDFFNVMGVHPALGRDFAPEEQRIGANPVAVVSDNYWRQTLGGSTDLSHFRLKIDNRIYSVVGVLPPGFHFPVETDIWFPRELEAEVPGRTAHNWRAVGRLRDAVTLAQARADLSGIGKHISEVYGKETPYLLRDIAVAPLQETMTSSVRPALFILLGSVAFLLLVACANVANLLLSQASARERELAIRSALGAVRGRLVQQFLTESLVLSLLGGVLGVFAAFWGVNVLLALAPKDLPRLDSVDINLPVLFFALGACVAVAVVLGVSTALRATSGNLRGSLLEGGRGQAGSRTSQKLGRVIVAGQVAITLSLLVGAGLLGRSLFRVLSVDPGFQTEHVLTMTLDIPGAALSATDAASKATQSAQFADLFARLREIPGVGEVGAAEGIPLDEGFRDGAFIEMTPQEMPKRPEDLEKMWSDKTRSADADYCAATGGYFRALGIRLIRGRLFDDRDGINSPHVALISESLARMRWPKEDPIGRTLEFGNMDGDLRLLTIVGIVSDTHETTLEKLPEPVIYTDLFQRPRATITVVMRADASPASVFSAARGILRDFNPEVPPRFRTFSEVYATSLGSRQFNVILIGAFAATALLLAVAGIYGVMAYAVTRRTQEFGVRVALGAQPRDILQLVLRHGMVTVGAGIAAGILGAFALTRTMQSLLFDVSATDPVTFAGVAVLLTIVALLASYLPARRATQVDPVIALRNE